VNKEGTDLRQLKNRYHLMRHGRSLANEQGLIISHLSTGTGGWGLSSNALPGILKFLETFPLPGNTRVYSSPFLRAVETASVAAQVYGCPAPVITSDLRERYFGNLDGGPDSGYAEVWREDEMTNHNCARNVESPSAVLERLIRLIRHIEAEFRDSNVLLVSHGDPLDILLTHAAGLPEGRHRNIPSMKTGEIRRLFS
jgi:probable phosphoglycerate mutase